MRGSIDQEARALPAARARGRRRDFWRTAQWPIIWILAAAAVALGYVGFARYYRATGEARSPVDLLYYALQLFPLQSGAVAGPVPWQLQVARFLAPLVGIYTAAQALAHIFGKQLQVLKVRLYKGHIVICGLGRKGELLARRFRERGEKVVAIELEEDNDAVGSSRALGARVILGDASDRAILREAGVERARQVIAVCGSDGANAEIAVHARELSAGRKTSALTCVVHIFDAELCALLRERELMEGGEDRFRLEFFNVFETGAAAMLEEVPWRREGGSPSHLLVVGLGQLGESLVLRAARGTRPPSGERLQVTVVDREARRKSEALCFKAPFLARSCDLTPYDLDVRSPEFQRAGFAFDAGGSVTLAATYVCLDDDAAGLAAALALHRLLRGSEVPIVVRMAEESGLATLLAGEDRPGGRFENLRGFGLLERTCQPDQLLTVSRETLARAMHEAYLLQQGGTGRAPESNPALVPWEELSEELKESNRRQAGDIGRKLAAIGCELRALRGWEADPFELAPQEVELIAQMEHARWLEEKRVAGWTYAPGHKDPKERTNPNLLPWGDLTEATREMNRSAACEIPTFLASIGFEIRRVAERGAA